MLSVCFYVSMFPWNLLRRCRYVDCDVLSYIDGYGYVWIWGMHMDGYGHIWMDMYGYACIRVDMGAFGCIWLYVAYRDFILN